MDRIEQLLARQHGVIAREQLLAMAMATAQIDEWLRSGRLRRIHRGVYAVGHTKLTREGRWMAAVLAAGPGAVLSHYAAAQHWGLINPGAYRIEVTAPTYRHRGRAFTVHSSTLRADEITVHEGIPITSISRTLMDLAATLEPARLRGAHNQIGIRDLYDPISLEELLRRYPGKRGNKRLRAMLLDQGLGKGVTRSQLEDAFQVFVDQYGLPAPELNAPISLEGEAITVDCLWPARKVALELDSRGFHDNDLSFQSDRDRDRLLIAHGFVTPRATWRDVTVEHRRLYRDLARILGIA